MQDELCQDWFPGNWAEIQNSLDCQVYPVFKECFGCVIKKVLGLYFFASLWAQRIDLYTSHHFLSKASRP